MHGLGENLAAWAPKAFEFIRKFLLGRAYTRFAVALVAIGASLFAPSVWELAYSTLRFGLQWAFPARPLPPPGALDNPAGYVAGSALIACGLGLFLWAALRAERHEQAREAQLRYLRMRPQGRHNWITWTEAGRASDDPSYTAHLALRLESGAVALRVFQLDVTRLIEGCYCHGGTPVLRLRNDRQALTFLDDFASLAQPLRLEPHTTLQLAYQREGRGPTRLFEPEQLENGEYLVSCHYRFEDETTDRELSLMLKQDSGDLIPIESLSPPPLLNDRILALAHARGVINATEHRMLRRLNERERYLALRFGETYCAHFADLLMPVLPHARSANDKIRAAGLTVTES